MRIQKNTINTDLTLRCNELKLHHGGVAHDVRLHYSVTGELSLPIIIVLGGLSANHIVTTNQQQGWWDDVVGSGKTIDTDKFCVISLDYYTGVASNKDNKHTLVSSYDQARLVQQLLCQLNISDVYAIIGSSYGGMVALAFAELFPHLLGKLICICATHRSSIKSIALREIQRDIVNLARENNCSKKGLALARSIAMIGYRGEQELEQRFSHTVALVDGCAHFEVSRYLKHHGQKFAKHFCIDKFINLSRSIDLHHVDASKIQAETLLVPIHSDQMVPAELVNELHNKIKNCRIHSIDSKFGHDAFLIETQLIAKAIKPFIQ